MTPATLRGPFRIPVREEVDVAVARARARELALEQGFAAPGAAAIATAVTEVARNLVVHAGGGEVLLEPLREPGRRGILVVARDAGPGIASVEDALRDGFSTAGGLGLGLGGARRLMDELTVDSSPGAGTTVTMRKWVDHG